MPIPHLFCDVFALFPTFEKQKQERSAQMCKYLFYIDIDIFIDLCYNVFNRFLKL